MLKCGQDITMVPFFSLPINKISFHCTGSLSMMQREKHSILCKGCSGFCQNLFQNSTRPERSWNCWECFTDCFKNSLRSTADSEILCGRMPVYTVPTQRYFSYSFCKIYYRSLLCTFSTYILPQSWVMTSYYSWPCTMVSNFRIF